MTQLIAPAPVRRAVTVKGDPDTAFAVFTGNMGKWWPKSHSIGASPQADVVVEPRAGGRWYERGEDGSECPWGHVIDWDPPGRVLLAWQLNAQWAYDPALVTEVEVRFTDAGGGTTRVELEHRLLERFGEQAEMVAAGIGSPEGWQGILGQYAALMAAG